MPHLTHIDGLRAIAVLAVMAYHVRGDRLPGGFIGVDVFFAISGFVVTSALAQHRDARLASFIAGFYHRRLTRILPALLVVLVVTALLWILLVPRSWLSGQAERVGLFAFAGLSNWALADQSDAYFAPRAEFSPFTQTWSLGVEEQFYLLAPWLLFLAWRYGRPAIGSIAAIALASLACSVVLTLNQSPQAFYNIASRLWELAAGSLWFLLLWNHKAALATQRRGVVVALAWPGLAWLTLAVALCLASPQGTPVPWAVAAVAASLMLIGTPRRANTRSARLLSMAPLRFIGLRSYSLYLWHWPAFVLMRWTLGMESIAGAGLAVALTFGLAELSYRWVERPLRVSAGWHRRPAWLTITTLAGAAVGSFLIAQLIFDMRHEWSMSTVERHADDWYALHADPLLANTGNCAGAGPHYRALGPLTVIEHLPCGKPAAVASKQVFVLGDSHATAYLPMLHRLSREESIHVAVYQIPGCPFVDLRAPMGYGGPPHCLEQARAALKDIVAIARPGDMVVLASLRLPRFGDQWGVFDDAAVLQLHFGSLASQARRAAVIDAHTWLTPLLRQGLHVVIAAPTPIFRAPPFRCVDAWTRHNPICAHGLVETRTDEQTFREPVMQAIAEVVKRQASDHLSVFDPFDALCPGAQCQALEPDGRPLFFDADHLSRFGNERVYPSFLAHWQCVNGGAAHCGSPPPPTPPTSTAAVQISSRGSRR